MADTSIASSDVPISQVLQKEPNVSNAVSRNPSDEYSNNTVNPLNWHPIRKWSMFGSLALTSFVVPFGSSVAAPATVRIVAELGDASPILRSFIVSIFVLGYALGPLLAAPISELHGRVPVYHACNAIFVAFTLGCALSTSIGMLLAFRFLQGIGGSSVFSIIPGTIGELFSGEQRGFVVAIWAIGPVVGPVVGPLCGGFIAQSIGWRWTFWIVLIASAMLSLVQLFLLRETYKPAILRNQSLDARASTADSFQKAISRPVRMLCQPIVLLLSLFNALIYGLLYLFLTGIPDLFHSMYGFSEGTTGLAYLGLGIGMILALIAYGSISDRLVASRAGQGRATPELRLLPMVAGGVTVPIGMFLYGWAAHYQVFWLVPMLGEAIAGIGIVAILATIPNYLIDAFTAHAASANAALTLLRALFGAFLPLAGPALFANLGYGWGNSLLAFIALAFLPAPWLFYRYGQTLRESELLKVRI